MYDFSKAVENQSQQEYSVPCEIMSLCSASSNSMACGYMDGVWLLPNTVILVPVIEVPVGEHVLVVCHLQIV